MLDSIKNMAISFKESLTERVKNPLIASYLLFLLAMNWKVLAILFFGEGDIHERMNLIDRYSYDEFTTLIVPLFLALIYVFIMPKINLFIQKYQEKTLMEQRQRKYEYELKVAAKRKKLVEENISTEMIRSRVNLDLKQRESEIDERTKEDDHRRKIQVIDSEHQLEIRRIELERDEYESKNKNLIHEAKLLRIENDKLTKENNKLNQTISRLNRQT